MYKISQTPSNKLPLFNGTSENDLKNFDKYLENIKFKKDNKNVIGGIFLAKSKSQILF